MAAFCACCGARITLKGGPCPVCGTPRHGMSGPDLSLNIDPLNIDPLNIYPLNTDSSSQSGENTEPKSPKNSL